MTKTPCGHHAHICSKPQQSSEPNEKNLVTAPAPAGAKIVYGPKISNISETAWPMKAKHLM